MRRWIGVGWFLLIVLAGYEASGALTPQVTASLSDTRAPLNREITLTVTLTGVTDQEVNALTLPEIPHFRVIAQEPSTSVQILDGQLQTTFSWHYTLIPQKSGRFTIPPVRVNVGGQTISTRPLSLEITAPTSPPPAHSEQAFEDPFRGGKQFVDVVVDKTTAYVNEPILYTFRYYATAALPTSEAPRYERPAFRGFWAKEWPVQGIRRETIAGEVYRVQEIHTTLFAQEPGLHRIEPPALHLPALGAFDQPRILRGRPVEIRVNPLPLEGRPPEFRGAVGRYQIRATVDVSRLERGEALTLTLRIDGVGHFESLRGPDLPSLPTFTQYAPTVRFEFIGSGPEPRGFKTFEYVLIPQQAGEQEIPGIAWAYFDPEEGRYRRVRTEPIQVTVVESATTGAALEKNAQETVGETPQDGLRPIKGDSVPLTDQRRLPLSRTGFWVWHVFWAGVFGASWVYRRHRKRSQAPLHRSQRIRPLQRSLERLARSEEDPREFATRLEHLLREFLTEQGVIPPGISLTQGLKERGLTERVAGLADLLARIETARFSPAVGQEERTALLQHARRVLMRLEEVL